MLVNFSHDQWMVKVQKDNFEFAVSTRLSQRLALIKHKSIFVARLKVQKEITSLSTMYHQSFIRLWRQIHYILPRLAPDTGNMERYFRVILLSLGAAVDK